MRTVVFSMLCLLASSTADAQTFKPKIAKSAIRPTPIPTSRLTLSGHVGPSHYPSFPMMPHRSLYPSSFPGSHLRGSIGPHSPLTPGEWDRRVELGRTLFESKNWWFLDNSIVEEALNPYPINRPVGGRHYLPESTAELMRQMLPPSELALFGLMDDPVFPNRGGLPFGPRRLLTPNQDLGMSSFPGPYWHPRIIPGGSKPMNSFGPAGFDPFGGALMGLRLHGPYPALIPGKIGPGRLTPPRTGVKGMAPTAKATPPPARPLTEDQIAFLKQFDADLATIIAQARGQQWQKVGTAIRKVVELPDLPNVITGDLKRLDAMAKDMEIFGQVNAISGAWAELPDMNSTFMSKAIWRNLAAVSREHLETLTFDIQICAIDVNAFRATVARIAAGATPAQVTDKATPETVEKLLGRAMTEVEMLVFLSMRTQNHSAEDMAAVLKKAN